MLDPLTHTVCLSNDCEGVNFCQTQLNVGANNTAFILDSMIELAREHIWFKKQDPCLTFTTVIDAFYEKISGYGFANQLFPLPECVSCLFQKIIYTNEEARRVQETLPVEIPKPTGEMKVDTVIKLIAGVGLIAISRVLSGATNVQRWSSRTFLFLGAYNLIMGSVNLFLLYEASKPSFNN